MFSSSNLVPLGTRWCRNNSCFCPIQVKRPLLVLSRGKIPPNICVLSSSVIVISCLMLHVLGSIRLSPTSDVWKVGLVLRPVLLKEKCLDISNSTETQGVHLVGQGCTWWKQWATWPQHLVCMIGMQQYKYPNACQIFKPAYHKASTPLTFMAISLFLGIVIIWWGSEAMFVQHSL